MKKHRRDIYLRAVAILAAVIAVSVLILHYSDQGWSNQYHQEETRESGNQEFMEEGTVEWNGQKYRKKNPMTVFLLAGVDKEDTTAPSTRTNYRNGGQADFLLLLAIDHADKQIHQLQIDRDTMAEVTILGVFGNETGTRVLQICLAHNYGARPEDNAKYTVKAVRKLMNDLEIDGYYMVDYTAVPTLTDALDGVPVTIPTDMTSVNPEWTEGKSVILRGKDAENFVRSRKTVGAGTNEERMARQSIYMQSAVAKMKHLLAADSSAASGLIDDLRAIAVTNLSDQRLLEEIDSSRAYEVLPVDTLPGSYSLGENNYIEFYPEEGAATAWIMEHLYAER